MIAVVRYYLAVLGHSQRYLPAAVAFVAVLAVQYIDRNAPVLPEYAVSAGALFVVACWLTIALVDAEDPVQRLVTVSHARRLSTVVIGMAVAVLCCGAVLTAVSGGWAAIVHGGLTEIGPGLLAHFAAVTAGVAVGLPCSRLLIRRIGHTLVAALLALTVVLLLPWLPVLHPMLRALGSGSAPTAQLLTAALVSPAALVISGAMVTAIAHRRS